MSRDSTVINDRHRLLDALCVQGVGGVSRQSAVLVFLRIQGLVCPTVCEHIGHDNAVPLLLKGLDNSAEVPGCVWPAVDEEKGRLICEAPLSVVVFIVPSRSDDVLVRGCVHGVQGWDNLNIGMIDIYKDPAQNSAQARSLC